VSLDQLRERARQWKVSIHETFETPGSVLAFGVSRGSHVVLKIIKQQGDEWLSGEVLQAFNGEGAARVYECDAGAVLLERLEPGEALVNLVRNGNDEQATEVLAEVMRQMAGHTAPAQTATLFDWAGAFDRYLTADDKQISHELVIEARDWYQELAASQGTVMLLHGDLQHYNVLLDSKRGWVAIDPKGVVGEMEYEVGAILRNPVEQPDVFVSVGAIKNRLEILATRLGLNYQRALAWAFSQAVLSAIWCVEDGEPVQPDHCVLQLARVIKPLLSPRF
jgi:streptomycin 6-kinase